VTATTFNDSGLAAATQYSWTVTGVNANNAPIGPGSAGALPNASKKYYFLASTLSEIFRLIYWHGPAAERSGLKIWFQPCLQKTHASDLSFAH
jgi:hypothetical protein